MLTLILTLIACGGTEDTGTTGDATAGADVYAASCASCHGADGEGASGPAMADVVPGATPADLESIILDGSGDMAPVALDATETADVIAYMVETWG